MRPRRGTAGTLARTLAATLMAALAPGAPAAIAPFAVVLPGLVLGAAVLAGGPAAHSATHSSARGQKAGRPDRVRALPRRRPPVARPAGRRAAPPPTFDRMACKAWKYHGADRIPRPYDPDRYAYTEEYRPHPDRPDREEAARRADAAFPLLIDARVLRMLRLINRVRERRGHTILKLEPRLMAAARRHNLDIARHALMQHTGTDCSQLGDRVWDAGYTWLTVTENLAGGEATAEATMRQWMGSVRHLMQMTLRGLTEAGIAYDHNPDPPRRGVPIRHFWTLIMARPDPWRDRRWPEKPVSCTGGACPGASAPPLPLPPDATAPDPTAPDPVPRTPVPPLP